MDPSEFQWNRLKNERLKKIRGVSFEEILKAKMIVMRGHPTREDQEVMFFEHKGKVWVVPCVRCPEGVFLKTLYPSRYYTKKYQRGEL